MSGSTQVFKNVAWISIGQLISKAFRAAFVVLAARIIGVEEYGVATYVLAHIGFFAVFADCGIVALVTRECARGTRIEQERYVRTGLLLKLILTSLVTLFLIAAMTLSTSEIDISIGVLALSLIIFTSDSIKDFSAGVMIGREKTKTEALINLSTSLLLVVVGIPLMYAQRDAMRLLAVYATGSFLGILLEAIVIYRSRLVTFSKVLISDMKQMLRTSFIFGLQNGFMMLVFSFDALMIGWLMNEHALGIYGASQKLPLLLNMVPGYISQGFLPELTRSAHKDVGHFSRILTKGTTLIALIGVPLIVGGEIIAGTLIPALFGGEYREAIPVFRVLLGMNFFSFFSGILTIALYAHDKQKMVVNSTAIGALLSVVGNIILIPMWGIMGSAVASVLAQAAMFAILLYNIRSLPAVTVKLEKVILKLILGVGLMGITAFALQHYAMHISVVIAGAVIVYAFCMYSTFKKLITS